MFQARKSLILTKRHCGPLTLKYHGIDNLLYLFICVLFSNLVRVQRLFSRDTLEIQFPQEYQDLDLPFDPKDVVFYYMVSTSYWVIRTHADHRVGAPCRPHYVLQQQPNFHQVSHSGIDQTPGKSCRINIL